MPARQEKFGQVFGQVSRPPPTHLEKTAQVDLLHSLLVLKLMFFSFFCLFVCLFFFYNNAVIKDKEYMYIAIG